MHRVRRSRVICVPHEFCADFLHILMWFFMSIASPSQSFYNWLYGLPCYDRYFAKRGTYVRRLAMAYWLSLARPQVLCANCTGCGCPLFFINNPFGSNLPFDK